MPQTIQFVYMPTNHIFNIVKWQFGHTCMVAKKYAKRLCSVWGYFWEYSATAVASQCKPSQLRTQFCKDCMILKNSVSWGFITSL